MRKFLMCGFVFITSCVSISTTEVKECEGYRSAKDQIAMIGPGKGVSINSVKEFVIMADECIDHYERRPGFVDRIKSYAISFMAGFISGFAARSVLP